MQFTLQINPVRQAIRPHVIAEEPRVQRNGGLVTVVRVQWQIPPFSLGQLCRAGRSQEPRLPLPSLPALVWMQPELLGAGGFGVTSVPAACLPVLPVILSFHTSPCGLPAQSLLGHSLILAHWSLWATILSTIIPLGLGPRGSQD